MIGQHGLELIREIAGKKGRRAGECAHALQRGMVGLCRLWFCYTAPIYAAHDSGLPVHVWVAETRPRSQGSKLTAWELGEHKVPHTIIADSASGHLMQRGAVDLVIVGNRSHHLIG